MMPSLSATSLFAGLLFSSIGFFGFAYGKKMGLWKPIFIGIALMAYPYFIESTIAVFLLGFVGSLALFLFRH